MIELKQRKRLIATAKSAEYVKLPYPGYPPLFLVKDKPELHLQPSTDVDMLVAIYKSEHTYREKHGSRCIICGAERFRETHDRELHQGLLQ